MSQETMTGWGQNEVPSPVHMALGVPDDGVMAAV